MANLEFDARNCALDENTSDRRDLNATVSCKIVGIDADYLNLSTLTFQVMVGPEGIMNQSQ